MAKLSETIHHPATPRCVALVGPQGSGKTSLLESLLFLTGATARHGSVQQQTSVGDASDEARQRQMSTEVNVAATQFLGESWTFLDCPGSVELWQDTMTALMVADAAIVVCEPGSERVRALAPTLRFLDENAIPHILFVNKLDTASLPIRELLEVLQSQSTRPLVLREVPIREGEAITGYVDLVSERAYRFTPASQPSTLIKIPESVAEREQSARQELLEHLADFDDELLEQLLEEVQPPPDEIYSRLADDLARDLIVPVMLGVALQNHGVRRLLKLLRHEVPECAGVADRLAVPDASVAAQVFHTVHAPHTGKLSVARILRGRLVDGTSFGDARVSGMQRLVGSVSTKLSEAGLGEVVALGRLEAVRTGDLLVPPAPQPNEMWPEPLEPVYELAVRARDRNDEVKLTAAFQKLGEEDPSLRFIHDPELSELRLAGQGDVHLQLALDRLKRKYGVSVTGQPPEVPYRETIRKSTTQHARFKRQSGGHGQFGDVHVAIRPLPRGSGIQFEEKIVGGSVPRQYIPGVEAGVHDFCHRGPLGFPVVDMAVTLTDGQYHSVDSSDLAFRTAARMALQEGVPKCEPVLLEPIHEVTVAVPSEFTPKAQRALSQRRGQILGFDARPGWDGWDEVKAYLPQAEMHDLVIELRSLSLGLGTFSSTFSHMAELTGRLADRVVEIRQSAQAAQ